MIVNDRDVLLRQAPVRFGTAGTGLVLAGSSPTIRTAADGTTPNPSTVTLTLTLLGVTGTPTWSVTGGTLTGTGDTTRTLAASSMTADVATVTATVTYAGVQYVARYSIAKVRDGSKGDPGTVTKGDTGPAGPAYATAFLYQWSTVQPPLPNAGSTFDWAAGANTAYAGTDGWAIAAPANPGSPGIKLWVVSKAISAAGGTTQSTVSYSSGAAISAYAQNGAKGDAGAPGIKSAAVRAYQWGNGPAPTIAGASTYTWSTATYNAVPNSWSKTKPTPPGGGFTLYEATVNIVESAGATDSAVDWAAAAIVGISYIGVNGTKGDTGAIGASAAIAYTLVDGASLAATPTSKQEPGRNLPTTGTWGETRAWTAQPAVPAANQSVFQSNGIYDPSTDKTTWGLPYLSNLRVGSLSALAVRTGSLTIDNIASANGNFSVDANGSVVARAISIQDASGSVILAAGRALADAYVPASAQNSQLQPSIAAAATAAPIGSNLISNSDFEAATVSGWGYGYSEVAGQYMEMGLDGAGADWCAIGTHNIYVHRGSGGLNGVVDVTCQQNIPVVAGARFEVSGYLASHRCDSTINVRWFRQVNGVEKDDVGGEQVIHPTVRSTGGQTLGNWARAVGFVVAPPNAQYARIAMRSYTADAGVNDSWCWGTRFFFAEAQPNQTQFSAFSKGAPANPRALGYSGDLNATVGATLGVNVSGTINDSNAAGLVTVSNLRVVSSKIGSYSTPGSGGRVDLNDGGMRVYAGSGAKIYIGNLIN